MPRQLRKIQAFLELSRHFRICQISSNATYASNLFVMIMINTLKSGLDKTVAIAVNDEIIRRIFFGSLLVRMFYEILNMKRRNSLYYNKRLMSHINNYNVD